MKNNYKYLVKEFSETANNLYENALTHPDKNIVNAGVESIYLAGWSAGRRHGYEMGFSHGKSTLTGKSLVGVWAAIMLGVALGVYVFSLTLSWVT